jgi:MscS family membrane protein
VHRRILPALARYGTVALLCGCAGAAPRAAAQTSSAQNPPNSPATATSARTDPLGRDTPRGTIAGFNLAVHRDDFLSAARYLQVTPAQRANTEPLARDLTELIDRHYIEPITALSDVPEGAADDGLSFDRERVVLTIAHKRVDVELVRVKDPQAGLVWLISSQALAQVPALRRAAGVTWLERLMPAALVGSTLFGVSVAQWIAWAATLVIPFAVLCLLSTLFITFGRRAVVEGTRRKLLNTWYAGLRWPVIFVVTLGIHVAIVPLLGFSLRFRLAESRIVLVPAVVSVAWLLWRLMALTFTHARIVAQRRGQAGVRSLLLLAERVCKTLLILVGIFALLTVAGVDTTTALAGVGIGGVAFALGAQKTVENLLGGVFLLTDRALAVGDTCSISNRVGVVEDITMRSVRLRTIEQTLLSVPTGILSQASVENFATRTKILVHSTLRISYGTTADQMRRVLNGISALLNDHPDLETETARIRLADFGVRAIDLELFAYVMTPDFLKFLAIREQLLLQIAAVVESSGTSFARPTVLYEEPSLNLDAEIQPFDGRGAVPGRSAAHQGV